MHPALLLTFALSAVSTSAHLEAPIDRVALAEALHVRSFEVQNPEVRTTPSGRLIHLELDGEPVTLVLCPHSVRKPGFRVWNTDAVGEVVPFPVPAPRTFRGHLAERPDHTVAVGFTDDGFLAVVRGPEGRTHFVQPLSRVQTPSSFHAGAESGWHVVHAGDDLDLPAGFCGADLLPEVSEPPTSLAGGSTDGGSGCFRVSELGFDVDFEYYQASGSSVPQTVANIEAVMVAVNVAYAHEVQIEHVLTDVIVRSSEPDPYSSFEPGELLDALRNTWNGPLSGLHRDHVHLATGREMNSNVIGLAYVGVICNTGFGFGLTQFNLGFGGHVNVVAHELGHNWAAPHCLDNICGIMCGGCVLEFGPVTTETILNHRNNVGCLDVSDGFADPTPPEAERDSAQGSVQILIDVLANDLDGNCDTVVIDGFDSLSEEGASISLSPGTGPGGRDELLYVPGQGFQGRDGFEYTAGDGTGLTESAPVVVATYDAYPDLTGHWKLDEVAGPDLVDSSSNPMVGTFLGNPAFAQAGAAPGTGTAIRFGGFGARARVLQGAQLRGLTEAFSVVAWVRPESASGAARIFGNGSSWRFALRDGVPALDVDGQAVYEAPASLPLDTWSHVAVSYRAGGSVRLYVDGLPVLQTGAGGSTSAPVNEWYLGGGSGVTTALFPGRIDDLQVYDHELGDEGVASLFAQPGSVWIPCKESTRFCTTDLNSTGLPAAIHAVGTPSLSGSDLLLTASTIPSGQFGVFFFGGTPLLQPFGEGTLCVGGMVTRLAPVSADGLGLAQSGFDLDTPFYGIEVGDRWLLQFWYRDPLGGPAGFNLTDAVAIEVCP